MKYFEKKNYATIIITFVIGLVAVGAIYGLANLFDWQSPVNASTFSSWSDQTINGKATKFLLDDQGKVNGLLLDSGDQLRFSPETGLAIAAVVKVGDDISATGDAGTQSNYGRAFHVKQLMANGQTFTEIKEPKKPHGEHPKPKHGERPMPPNGERPMPPNGETPPPPPVEGNMPIAPLPSANQETFNAGGAIGTFLVGMRGEINGLILASGEQIRFSPKVGEQITAAGVSADSQVSVTGFGVKNEYGTVIRPNSLKIGSQTFTLGK